MKSTNHSKAILTRARKIFRAHGVELTMGGEPTYVPTEPLGAEWSITALGPTKLGFARALGSALVSQSLPNALPIYSPGKLYPGEVNPRWTLYLLWRLDSSPLLTTPASSKKPLPPNKALAKFQSALCRSLRISSTWLELADPVTPGHHAWVLPLDHDNARFLTAPWDLGPSPALLPAEGPAGLRLPLQDLPPALSRRALTVEWIGDQLQIFIPPLFQPAFLELLTHIEKALGAAHCHAPSFAGYIPSDDSGCWEKLAIASDPGVLEINLPPCSDWSEYAQWLDRLERAAAASNLCSHKQLRPEEQTGTGGGNHLLFGGPSLDRNALFTHPGWITSLLRYWQHHPSLAYLFTGQYVGASSQAPRPDESARALYDLEMAYQFLEQLPPGDHRQLISETLRHLHTDTSGNTHRSEISFDKFWNLAFDGGCRGLIEFRAVETLPRADWMSAVAQLWWSLAAHLLEQPFTKPLLDQSQILHDRFFLPAYLWNDLSQILRDLARAGFPLPESTFRAIADWRLPVMLDWQQEGASLTIRKALESWPLLCETPLEGGSTSRFVDTSIERLEFLANPQFARHCKIRINGRLLPLQTFPDGMFGAGLRYRRSALHPSLHPGIAPQLPLSLDIARGRSHSAFRLEAGRREFTADAQPPSAPSGTAPCRRLNPQLLTFDLRLP